jgi:hypothetical protein
MPHPSGSQIERLEFQIAPVDIFDVDDQTLPVVLGSFFLEVQDRVFRACRSPGLKKTRPGLGAALPDPARHRNRPGDVAHPEGDGTYALKTTLPTHYSRCTRLAGIRSYHLLSAWSALKCWNALLRVLPEGYSPRHEPIGTMTIRRRFS